MNRLPQSLPQIRYALLALTLIGNSATTLKADEAKSKPVIVSKILRVSHEIQKSQTPNLIVNVTGEVPTGGYTAARLLCIFNEQPPKDGIQAYILTAVPPSGPALTVISEVKASVTWKKLPSWMKGIRVHGVKEGIVVVKFEQTKPRFLHRRFSGISKEGSFEKALAAAVAKLNQALPEGGIADASASWKVDSTSGQVGGIADLNQITVTISAERQPPWPKKKQPKKQRQQKKSAASE